MDVLSECCIASWVFCQDLYHNIGVVSESYIIISKRVLHQNLVSQYECCVRTLYHNMDVLSESCNTLCVFCQSLYHNIGVASESCLTIWVV